MKKEETNDIIQYLIPALEKIGISRENCKIDVTTEKSGKKRGDIWISLKKQSDKDFENNIIALIEAKHKNSTVSDMEWRNAMQQGKEKALKQGLNYYIVTNCRSDFRFYNAHTDEEIVIDGRVLTKLVPVEALQKIQSQVSPDNSYVVYKTSKITCPISENKFRTTLKKLADIYRSAGLKKGDERIDPTVSFVVLKYIYEKEQDKRTLPKEIKLWHELKSVAESEDVDLKAEFKKMSDQIWGEKSEYKNNIYRDFKDLIVLPDKLKNDHFKKIYKELDQYHFHGANFDLFGAIYEEFASQTKKKEFGEFYTRRHITGVVARLLLRNELSPRDLKICDPACGTGGFLTEAYKVLINNYSVNGKLNERVIRQLQTKTFWGYDNDEKSVARTKLNMFLVGDGHVHIYENDSLVGWNENMGWKENEFDYIMTNPPMGNYDGEAKIGDFDFTNEKRYELLFVEKVIKATKPGGEIAIVINDGALESPSRKRFREKLLKTCNIYAIISLTKFAFAPYTKEKTYILFMQKKQVDEVGEIQKFPIWHFILDYDGYANSDKRYRTKYHDDIPELEEKFDGAVKLAKLYEEKREEFESRRYEFEREVNDREKEEGLWGMKYGYVEIERINEENFYNLLSEFYLRPIKTNQIKREEYKKEISELLKRADEIYNRINKLLQFVTNVELKFDDMNGEFIELSKIFDFKGGNSGITEEFIYYNQPTNENDKIPILSSATRETNFMGYISRNAKLQGKKLRIFKGPCILVARNGYAGKMTYIPKGEFTTNDHAYVLTPKKNWRNKINLRWFIYQYQELFFNLVTSKSDNATFNKEYAQKQKVKIPDITVQNKIAEELLIVDELAKKLKKLNREIEELLEYEII